jgi:hypothetical protein
MQNPEQIRGGAPWSPRMDLLRAAGRLVRGNVSPLPSEDLSLDVFMDRYHVDDAIVNAYKEDFREVMATGVPDLDEGLLSSFGVASLDTFRRYNQCFGLNKKGTFSLPVPGQSPVPTRISSQREITRKAGEAIDSGRLLEYEPHVLIKTKQDAEMGIRRSQVLGMALSVFSINYAPEMHPSSDLDSRYSIHGMDDLSARYGPNLSTAGLREIAFYMRESYVSDMSKKRLDKRVDVILPMMALETSALVLNDIAILGGLGNERTSYAMNLFMKYKPHAAKMGLGPKIDFFEELEAFYTQYVSGPRKFRSHAARALFDAHAQGAQRLCSEIRDWVDAIGSVYETLGYDKPEILLTALDADEPTPEPVVRVPLSEMVTVEEISVRPEPDEAVITALQERSVELSAEIDSTFMAWRLNPSQCKKLNFKAMHGKLTKGYADTTGEFALPSQDASTALGLIGVLRGFAFISRREPEAALRAYDHIVGVQKQAQQTINQLRNDARDGNVTGITYPNVPDIQDIMNRHLSAADWPAVRELILETWPAGKTPEQAPLAVADRIGGLLSAIRARQANPQ